MKTDRDREMLCGVDESKVESVDQLAILGSTRELFYRLKLNYLIHLCDVRTTQKVKQTCHHQMAAKWKSWVFAPYELKKLDYTKSWLFELWRPSLESRDSEHDTFSYTNVFGTIQIDFSRFYTISVHPIAKLQLARIHRVLTFTSLQYDIRNLLSQAFQNIIVWILNNKEHRS
jgi:hypothetical protein